MQKIVPCLWFDGRAEEAMLFYQSIFSSAKTFNVMRYTDAGPGPEGSVLSVMFELEGQEFIALNGGPMFKFTPAISLFVKCSTQDEVDMYWTRLLEGGMAQQCGWLNDKFGVSWQIVPAALSGMLQDMDAGKASRVMQAMLKMVKLEIKLLQAAYDGI